MRRNTKFRKSQYKMESFKLYYVLLQVLVSVVFTYQYPTCTEETRTSGELYGQASYYGERVVCWSIAVPEGTHLELYLKELNLYSGSCSYVYVNITVSGIQETYKYCSQDTNRKPIAALNDVTITLVNDGRGYSISFRLDFQKVSLTCMQKNHFRCSNETCIHQRQVCDGVKDCANGKDEIGCETGILAVKGVSESRRLAIAILKMKQSPSSGWGRNTNRAITALYLSGSTNFDDVDEDDMDEDDIQEELMAKQLELQTSVALLRNSTDPISVSDLSMYVNALTASCHSPRQFYGYDLLNNLAEQLSAAQSPNPGAYLTLCNANWSIPEQLTSSLLEILQQNSSYSFHLDVQAMAVLALSCAKNKTNNFEKFQNASKLYNETIKQFIDGQLEDGSFGNIYSTALVTQALIASGQQNNKSWKLKSTVEYLMKELRSFIDFLALYYTLPVLNGQSLLDLANVNCSNHRKHGEDDEISDILNKLGGKMRVQYSLIIGDKRDIVHTIYLRIPENSSAFDVMKVAKVADYKYAFLHRDLSGKQYVYEIAGLTNDPEAGLFWFLFIENSRKRSVKQHTESPDKLIIEDGDHLIMWYKTEQTTMDLPPWWSTTHPERNTTVFSTTGYPSTRNSSET